MTSPIQQFPRTSGILWLPFLKTKEGHMPHSQYKCNVRVLALVFVKTIHLGYDHCLVQRALEYIIVKANLWHTSPTGTRASPARGILLDFKEKLNILSTTWPFAEIFTSLKIFTS
jgi:hypothetical protein